MYWRGFLALTDLIGQFDMANSDVMLMMACGHAPADLLDAILARWSEMYQYSRLTGLYLFSQGAHHVLTEFIAESHEITEMAEHMQVFFL
jgi:hypothetical protein